MKNSGEEAPNVVKMKAVKLDKSHEKTRSTTSIENPQNGVVLPEMFFNSESWLTQSLLVGDEINMKHREARENLVKFDAFTPGRTD
jgi:hypothetical protein